MKVVSASTDSLSLHLTNETSSGVPRESRRVLCEASNGFGLDYTDNSSAAAIYRPHNSNPFQGRYAFAN